jgi:hypothetical protein
MQSITTAPGGKVKQAGVGLEPTPASNLLPNNCRLQRPWRAYLDPIRTIGAAKFDRFAPPMFERIRKVDALFRAETGGRVSLSPILDELRAAIAGGGFKGLEDLAKKYGIPVALLTTAAGLVGLGASEGGTASPEA